VRTKRQLLQLVFERVTEEAKLAEPDPSRWREQLRAFAHRMREVPNNHRDVARLSIRPSLSSRRIRSEMGMGPFRAQQVREQLS
jgi:hypothetical protein